METRTCAKCGKTKSLTDFAKDVSQPLGYGYACKHCKNKASREWKKRNPDKHQAQIKRWQERNPERRKENARRWAEKNKDRVAENHRRRKREDPEHVYDIYLRSAYGAPAGTYAQLLSAQGGKCAICGATDPGRKLKRFHLDHCHDTNQIRGLLCGSCNVGIAHLKHSEEVILKAVEYLRRYRLPESPCI